MIRILIPLLLLSTSAIATPKDNFPRSRVHEALRQKIQTLSTKTIALLIVCDEKDCVIANVNGEDK